MVGGGGFWHKAGSDVVTHDRVVGCKGYVLIRWWGFTGLWRGETGGSACIGMDIADLRRGSGTAGMVVTRYNLREWDSENTRHIALNSQTK